MLPRILSSTRQGFSFVNKMAQRVAEDTKLAQRVQGNVMNEMYSVEHEAKIRQKATIESSVSSLEKELREEIAKSLRKSEDKVLYLISKAKESYEKGVRGMLSAKEVEEHN